MIFLLGVFLALGGQDVFAVQLGKIAAVVNRKPITMYDLQRAAVPELKRAKATDSKTIDAIMRRVLDNMILDILVQEEAKRLKITVPASEVDGRIAEIMKSSRLSKARFEAELAKEGLTVAELRKNIERQILGQKVLGVEVGRRTVVTPEEIDKYYNEHKDTLYDRRDLHMGILIYNPKAPAATISRQLQSGEISFAEACAKYSIHPTRERGGDTGKVEWDRLNKEMLDRLMAMKPGTVSDIFIIHDDKHKMSFKAQVYLFRPGGGEYKLMTKQQATPMIMEILRAPKSKDRFDDYSSQLKKKAVIDIRL
ncbi:MAG: SurA N-terminal domain-containing protein [Desulfovibrionaceae bacterium]|nr:SurA N-terminal domain-containing protein [Desulfovibrionaceae bacterium]